ncbi:MAG: AmmeMemoRadiSam system protein B [candidate division WOR-3 bacterium]
MAQIIRQKKKTSSFLFFFALLVPYLFCAKEGRMRRPCVAGQFYPGDFGELKEKITSLLSRAQPPVVEGKIWGILVPHAGYDYSGEVAAYAYKAITGQDYQTVILLGPSHGANFSGFALYAQGKWQTPLGEVEIDEVLAKEIMEKIPLAKDMPSAHNREHSLEVQIPFLQTVLRNFKILPIMMLFPSWQECETFAKNLAKIIKDKNVLLLASTDLYHGYSYEECLARDKMTIGYIERFDPKGLYDALISEEAQACGGFPVVSLLLTLKELGIRGAKLLKRTNSNEVMGIKGGYCVGYASFIFYQEEEGKDLSAEEGKELLKIARTTLEKYIKGEKVPEFSPFSEKLKEKRGVFVTLKKRGDLRGCIGYIQGVEPLYKAVKTMTINSATEDPRFPPVRPEELKDIEIEITVLSPLRRISDVKEIIVGKHGIYIRKGFYSGLLLPQVATENNWNREQFLNHTCLKAGLEPSAWKDKRTEIYIFTGQIIKE